jgi:spermidine synthase
MMSAEPEVLETRVEETATLELVRRGEALEVRVDGRSVMRSDQRRGEQSLIELVLAPLGQRDDVTVLLAGLGMGFTLRALLNWPTVKRVDVVESSRAVIEWEARHFAGLNGDVLKDPRVKLHATDLAAFLKAVRIGVEPMPENNGWLALVLDLDEGPGQVWRAGNESFYSDEGIERLEAALRPGGVLATWSSRREPELVKRMHARLQNVAEVAVPVDIEGQGGLDYVYRGRRVPNPVEKTLN